MNTTLGDLLLVGVSEYLEDAGHIIAEAISEAEAATGAAKVSKTEPKSDAKATTPSASTAKVPT